MPKDSPPPPLGTCAQCMFYDTLAAVCRAVPPDPSANATPLWPQVAVDDWCAAWRKHP
jgi:hypothetical protein